MWFKKAIYNSLLTGIIVCVAIGLLPVNLCAQPVRDTFFINSKNAGTLTSHLYIYETNKLLTPRFVYDSINRQDFARFFPSTTYNDLQSPSKYYWLLLTVQNNLAQDETFYYQLNHPQLYSVIAYTKTGAAFTYFGKSGYAYPFDVKPYKYYDNVFPLFVKRGQTVTVLLFINIHNGHNPYFAPELSNTNAFKDKEERFYMVNGLIAGIMLTAMLLNIFLGIFLNEKLHFLYAVYIVCILYEIFLTQGLDRQYFYHGTSDKITLVRYIIPCCGIFLLAYVMQLFLNQKYSNSKIKIFVDIVNYCCVGATIFYCVYFLISPETSVVTAIYQKSLACLAVAQLCFVFASAIEKVIQGYKPAWFYIAAILCLFWGMLEFVLIYLGVNDVAASELKHPNDLQTGLVIETLVVFLGIIYRYNLFKKEKETLLTQINTYQATLIDKIVGAQEDERKRIAEDLHDDVGATLSALALHISNVPENARGNDEMESYYKKGLFLSSRAVDDIRTIAHNLLPKDFKAAGIFKILEQRVNELNAVSKVNFTLITDGDERKLPEVFAITIYRIINELLANIIKHSMASEASVQLLIEENAVQVMCEDDGIGFETGQQNNGIGLRNIAGRVEFLKGYINVDSNSNGTTTIVHIPL